MINQLLVGDVGRGIANSIPDACREAEHRTRVHLADPYHVYNDGRTQR